MTNPIRHIAGPYEDGVQQCVRCLRIIHDHRDVKSLHLNEESLRLLGFSKGRVYGIPEGSILHFGGRRWCQDIMYDGLAVNCTPMEAGL